MLRQMYRVGPALLAATAALFTVEAIAGTETANTYTAKSVLREVKTHPSLGAPRPVAGAEARLLRTPEGFFAELATTGLRPGHAYTLWLVAINAPDNCETVPCSGSDVVSRTETVRADVGYGDGMIAGPDGSARFAAFQPVGPFRLSWYGFGLEDGAAEVHFVVNDHGPLKPGFEHSMLTSYRAGCSDDSIPAAFPDTARADGEAGQNNCRLIQFVVFEPNAR